MKYGKLIALCVVALAACSGDKTKAENKPAETPKGELPKADDSRATAAGLGSVVEIKDEACACADKACADAVGVKLGKAIKDASGVTSDPQQFILLTNEAAKCLKKWGKVKWKDDDDESASEEEKPAADEAPVLPKADTAKAIAAGLEPLVKIRDEACKCTDKACSEAVAGKMASVGAKIAKANLGKSEMLGDQQQFMLLNGEIAECLSKAEKGG